MDADIGKLLRVWRKASSLKQHTVAGLLDVSQASVSRWESGKDRPSALQCGKIRKLMGSQLRAELAMERNILQLQVGVRILADLDGVKLAASTRAFKDIWPELAAWEGKNTADFMIGETAELFADKQLLNAIRREEIAMMTGVSDRHLRGFGDRAFRHRWAATFRKIGSKDYVEISFEPCGSDEVVGLSDILRIDEIT